MPTSKLQRFTAKRLYRTFPALNIKENYRPEWLDNGSGRLELDFFIVDFNVAIEVQGKQHYDYIEFFHSDYDGYLAQLKRDKDKKTLCSLHNVQLVEVSNQFEVNQVISELKNKEHEYGKFIGDRKSFFENNTNLVLIKYDKVRTRQEKKIQQLEIKLRASLLKLKEIEQDKDRQLDNIPHLWESYYDKITI